MSMPSKSDVSSFCIWPGIVESMQRIAAPPAAAAAAAADAGQRRAARRALALVVAVRVGADLRVGAAEQRVVRRGVDARDSRAGCGGAACRRGAAGASAHRRRGARDRSTRRGRRAPITPRPPVKYSLRGCQGRRPSLQLLRDTSRDRRRRDRPRATSTVVASCARSPPRPWMFIVTRTSGRSVRISRT